MMNEFLAELYGTRETIGAEDSSDVEKLAEAQILDNVLQSEGLDVDQLDDGDILKLAHEIFGDDSALVKSAMEDGEAPKKCDDCDKADCECDSSEKNAAEADLMGRIMAHSMVSELDNIEKTSGAKEKILGALGSAAKGEGLKGGLAKMREGKKLTAVGKAAAGMGKGSKRSKEFGALAGKKLSEGGKATKAGRLGALKGGAATGGLYGGAAALGGAGYAAGKSKESSALDSLAEQRALEILAENGIETETKLASAIEERAYEMLAENGYIE